VARFVIFDLFRTLVHGAAQDWERAAAEAAAIVGVEPTALLAAYHDTFWQRQVEWDSEQTVRILAERAGGSPSPAQVAQAAAVRRAVARHVLSAVQSSTLDVLDTLRGAGYRLGLVSNATSDTSESWPGSALAARFDVAVFSCEAGVAKPDPRIYLAATTALGAQPAECYYVGDGADSELAGAAALGMTVIRTTQHHDSDPSWLGTTITSLTDLAALLPDEPGAAVSL
jgi:putative hydrolase of the HAD superfamily